MTEKLHNRSFIFVAAFVACLAACAAMAGCSRHLPPGEHNNFHPYGVRRATLHFEYLGDIRGSEDIYIDSFGAREAHITHSELITPRGFRPTYTYTIRKGWHLTIVDSVRRVEVKLIDRTMDSVYHLLPSEVPTPEQEFQNIFAPQGFQRGGDTTILGLKAHLWVHRGTPGYLMEWRGIVIGSKSVDMGNENELHLLSIDTTSPIEAARFVPPSGFPVHDLTKLGSGAPEPSMTP